MDQELFGITPPKKLFVKLAIPSLVSMLFSSIYIMADEIGHPPRVRRLFLEQEKIDAYERIDNHRIL